MIYLDNAATTYPKPQEVYEALDNANRNLAFNAGRGSYKESQAVLDMIKETKNLVADLVGLTGETVSFESSATEALNLIINGLELEEGDTVYVSPFEHNAIMRPLHYLEKNKGIHVQVIPFDKKTWNVKIDELNDLFVFNQPKAVFLSHISNVTGYILPYEKIFELSKEYNAVINVLDCSQSLGVLNPDSKNVDFIVFAGHKSLYASFGIAGFINVTNIKLNIVKSGGTGSDSLNLDMPDSGSDRYESGSSNSVAIAGLNASLKWLKNNDVYQHEVDLTMKLIESLKKIPNVKLYLPEDITRVLGIVSINLENYLPSDVGTILSDDYNVCIRTGYHCAPLAHDFLACKKQQGTVRLSIGAFSTYDEIRQLEKILLI